MWSWEAKFWLYIYIWWRVSKSLHIKILLISLEQYKSGRLLFEVLISGVARHCLLPQEVVHLWGQRQAHGLRQTDQSRACSQDLVLLITCYYYCYYTVFVLLYCYCCYHHIVIIIKTVSFTDLCLLTVCMFYVQSWIKIESIKNCILHV